MLVWGSNGLCDTDVDRKPFSSTVQGKTPFFVEPDSLNDLAGLYDTQGQYGKAEPLCQRALAIREKALGSAHPDVAQSRNNLAELYRVQGRYPEAEPLYQRALAMLEKALGPEHPDVPTSLNNLAVLYKTQGQYGKAEPLYQRALAIREKTLGQEVPAMATSLAYAPLSTSHGASSGSRTA
jgi:tetratricopeptide (TPR) repeat protein